MRLAIKETAVVTAELLASPLGRAIPVVLEEAPLMRGDRVVITSGRDGRHSPGSLHYEDRALDFRGWSILAPGGHGLAIAARREAGRLWAARVQARLGSDLDVLWEESTATLEEDPEQRGDHLHVELDPKEDGPSAGFLERVREAAEGVS